MLLQETPILTRETFSGGDGGKLFPFGIIVAIIRLCTTFQDYYSILEEPRVV
jgi:hypothetical protein